MIRSIAWMAAVFCVAAGPAFAGNQCVQPYAPTIPNGATATKEQMLSAQDEVKGFLAASDNYQECIILDIKNQRDALAREQKTLDQTVADAANAQIAANQREKNRVGAEYNAAVQAYTAAHPTPSQ